MIGNHIAVKLGLTILGLLMAVMLPLSLVVNSIFSNFFTGAVERDIKQVAVRLANMTASGDQMAVNMIGMMAEMNDVDVVIYDQNGDVIAQTNRRQAPDLNGLSTKEILTLNADRMIRKEVQNDAGEPYLVIVSPMMSGTLQGALGVISSIQSSEDAVDQIQSLLILASIGAILLAVGITYIVSRQLSQPLLEMKNAAERMAEGDLDTKVEVRSKDEIGSLARTLNELGEELRRFRDTRSEFFANVSHELRTPITYLEGYSKVLTDGLIESEEERNKYLQIIHEEARRMKGLIEDLFELSKMEEGKINMNLGEIYLSEALQCVMDRVRPKANDKGLQLILSIESENLLVIGDGKRMEQIFFNLLDNAIRYTPQGTIRVRLHMDGSKIVTEISDTGVGIPKDELPYVFERFYRVEKSRSREYGGTGLGLAIAKNMVEKQNGNIRIESEVGRGTKITVTFPCVTEEVTS